MSSSPRTRVLAFTLALAAGAILVVAFLALRRADAAALAASPAAAPGGTVKPPKLPLLVLNPIGDWQATTIDGQVVGRDELKGKVVVIDLWATWCPPCIYELPGYVSLTEKYRDRGLVIVGLAGDKDSPRFRQFLKIHRVNYPVATYDWDLVNSLGLGDDIVMPTTLLIDREGRVRHVKVGPMEHADFEMLVKSLL